MENSISENFKYSSNSYYHIYESMRVKTEENDKIYLKNDWHEDLIER